MLLFGCGPETPYRHREESIADVEASNRDNVPPSADPISLGLLTLAPVALESRQ